MRYYILLGGLMKIVVCINHLPDTASKIILGPDYKSIDDSDITYVLNPYDEYAVEEAVKFKEEFSGEVTIISVGDESHKESIKKALAMGGDNAILIKGNNQLDSQNIAAALASEISAIKPDLVLLGKQSVDYDNSVMTPMLAELTDMNSVSLVNNIEISGSDVTAKREIEGGEEITKTSLPLIISVDKGINEPRYPTLKGIMQAKKKPLEEKEFQYSENKVEVQEIFLPEPKKAGEIIGTDVSAVPKLIDLLKNEAKVI